MDEYIRSIVYTFSFKNSYEADRMLKKHYETVFGIFDHRAIKVRKDKPLSGMAVNAGNTIGPDAITRYLLDAYEENHIYDISKLTFREYCALTRVERTSMDERCTALWVRRKKREEEGASGILNDINKTLKST